MDAKLTTLQTARLAARDAGQRPLCGSPRVGHDTPGHPAEGKTCRRPAGENTDHPGFGACSDHTGLMTSAKVAAARERAAYEVAQFRRFYGSRVEGISFEEALLEEMQRSVGVVRWLEERIARWGQDWDHEHWHPGETNLPPLLTEHHGFRTLTVTDSEFAAVLRQYLAERRHLAEITKAGIGAGIAKSIIELHQRQAEALHLILTRALAELAPDATDRVAVVLPRIIREVTGTPARPATDHA